jgi:hypothetical protein
MAIGLDGAIAICIPVGLNGTIRLDGTVCRPVGFDSAIGLARECSLWHLQCAKDKSTHGEHTSAADCVREFSACPPVERAEDEGT